MRALLLLLLTTSPMLATAAPITVAHQVRVFDANGVPVTGDTAFLARVYTDPTTPGSLSWTSPALTLPLADGFGTALIEMDDSLVAGRAWLSIEVGGIELDDRMPLDDLPRVSPDPDATIIASSGSRTFSDGSLATSCLAYRYPGPGRSYAGATGDGVYRLDPTGGDPADAVDLYCDMTTDGGGWTLIGKSGRGGYGGLTDQQYIDLIANPVAHSNPAWLTSPTAPTAGQQAWLNRPVTDALWDRSPHQIVRVDVSGEQDAANNGRYYQRRDGDLNGGGLWLAIRDSRLWSNGTVDNGLTGVGSVVHVGNDIAYDAVRDTFPNTTDGHMGWWDIETFTLADGTTAEFSRHFGLLCDAVGTRGWQWLLTAKRADSRWKVETRPLNAIVWVK